MPLIKDAVERNRARIAKNEVSGLAEDPEQGFAEKEPIIQGPMPGAVVTGLPVRGVYTPNQILAPDFMNNTGAMRMGPNLRSATFPPQNIFVSTSTGLATKKFISATQIAAQSALATAKAADATAAAVAKTLKSPVLAQIASSGVVDSTQPYFSIKGSVPPIASNLFQYTVPTPDTTVTWHWMAQALFRGDLNGTITPVLDGSLAVTGLPNGTAGKDRTFYFYPYYDEILNTINFVSGSQVSGPTLNGVTFNGSTGFVSTATNIGTAPIVFAADFWFSQGSGHASSFVSLAASQTGSITNSNYVFDVNITSAGIIQCQFNDGTGGMTTQTLSTPGSGYNDGLMHHIFVIVNDTGSGTQGSATIYVDGTSVASSTTLASQSGSVSTSNWWRIGDGLAGFFNGTISHVNVWYGTAASALPNSALVAQNYNSGSAVSQSGLESSIVNAPLTKAQFAWFLTETSGTSFADSISTNTGTKQGTLTLNTPNVINTAVGTPAIAWSSSNLLVLQQQQNQNRANLSNGALPATPATGGGGSGGGSGGGTGGGGGFNPCFSSDTLVVTQRGVVPISEITVFDFIFATDGNWHRVRSRNDHEYHGYMHKLPQGLGTPTHHIRMSDGELWPEVQDVFLETILYMGMVHTLEVDSDESLDLAFEPNTAHSFQLASGIFAHNSLPVK